MRAGLLDLMFMMRSFQEPLPYPRKYTPSPPPQREAHPPPYGCFEQSLNPPVLVCLCGQGCWT
jgi:hypothetical protein